jgi:methylene-tetrahydromethanopterin dehydrogenase
MEKPYILHMVTAAKNLSPFDVNMAVDAGWTNCVPYTSVEAEEVQALVQDAIFSRGPSGVKRTGMFFGGRDMHIAMGMLKICQDSMVPPFEISGFADPSGAFTTAAGMVAKVEKALKEIHNTDFKDKCVLALGGTGPVGMAAALIAAKQGAKVKIMGRQKDNAQRVAELCNEKYGVQVMSAEQVKLASKLKVAADVNAVPPSGIAGVGVMDDCVAIEGSASGAVGIGALAIGNAKYQTQHRLLKAMCATDKPVYYHFEHAFKMAREFIAEK